jgi:hypothetical protein
MKIDSSSQLNCNVWSRAKSLHKIIIYKSFIFVILFYIHMTATDSSVSDVKIPKIILHNLCGEKYYGSLGSYCWEICVDYAQPSSRTDLGETVKIHNEDTLTFNTVDHDKPQNFHVTIFSDGNIIMNTTVAHEIKLEFPKGKYFLSVMAALPGEGHVSYVFPIEIL